MEAQSAARGREYETIYILRPDVTAVSAEKVSQRVQEVVDREGGKLTLVETWGRRGLAYPVKKQRRGVYVYVKYLGGGRAVSELERNLRMLDDVIKYQTVQVNAEVDVATVAVSPDAVKFDAIEPPLEEEEEPSRARLLGLDQVPAARGFDRGENWGAGGEAAAAPAVVAEESTEDAEGAAAEDEES